MKSKHFVFALALFLCALQGFADGLNKPNLSKTSYTLISGETVTNQANGKAKLLVFFDVNNSKSKTTARNISDSLKRFSDIDIIFVETKRSSQNLAVKFQDKNATKSLKIAYDPSKNAENSMNDYAKLITGGKAPSLPMLVYIDKNNIVQFEEHAKKFTAEQIRESIDEYLESDGGSIADIDEDSDEEIVSQNSGANSGSLQGITLNGNLLGKTGEVSVDAAEFKLLWYLEDNAKISSFIIGKYEVTQELYENVMKNQSVTVGGKKYALNSKPSLCTAENAKYSGYAIQKGEVQKYHPVDNVTWFDAVYFCNVLSEKLGLQKAYNIEIKSIGIDGEITDAKVSMIKGANGYRLPTEGEWILAAKGGKPGSEEWKYIFSGADYDENDNLEWNRGFDKVGWYFYNISNGGITDGRKYPDGGKEGFGSHEVGKKAANSLGIYDMSGNVWEWCWDKMEGNENQWTVEKRFEIRRPKYDEYKEFGENPTGPENGPFNVLKGGSWFSDVYVQLKAAQQSLPGNKDDNIGFRIVRNAQ